MRLPSPTIRAVAALSVTQLIGWGATFWLPAVTGQSMAGDLGVALPVIMAGPTVMLIVMAAISWPLGGYFERYGARPIMTAGSPLGAIGLLTLASSDSLPVYFLAWIILGIAGACMLTTPAQIAVAEIAGDGARPALSVLILAGGLTLTIVWPLTGILQAEWGWRPTTALYAILMMTVCTALHLTTLARQPKEKAGATAITEPPSVDRVLFVMLAASFAANGFFTWGFALTIITLFEAGGLDHASALSAAALIGVAQWGGRMIDFLGAHRFSGFAVGLCGAALFPQASLFF
ncbi:MFS transporter [Neorhizobium sp. NPDC001467]|uniref:MFS transporter n=1 Tax=Neorhizobium sp. NPDC001467 TaxID=3390595 RepID=UPI003D02A716